MQMDLKRRKKACSGFSTPSASKIKITYPQCPLMRSNLRRQRIKQYRSSVNKLDEHRLDLGGSLNVVLI